MSRLWAASPSDDRPADRWGARLVQRRRRRWKKGKYAAKNAVWTNVRTR
jgi:hypothetical protein